MGLVVLICARCAMAGTVLEELRRIDVAGPVQAMAVSPDGALVATGTASNGKISLYSTTSGARVRTLDSGAHEVLGLAFSPDGERLACTADRDVILWKTSTGARTVTLAGHKDTVLCVAFAPDGKSVASAGRDHVVRLWDCDSGRPIRTLEGPGGLVFSLGFSRDGRRLATGNNDQERVVDIFDLASAKLESSVSGASIVYSVAFATDGGMLAAAGDGGIRLYDLRGEGEGRELAGPAGWGAGQSVAFSPDGSTLAGGDVQGNLVLWKAASGERLASTNVQKNGSVIVAYSRPMLAVACLSSVFLYRLVARVHGRSAPPGRVHGALHPHVVT